MKNASLLLLIGTSGLLLVACNSAASPSTAAPPESGYPVGELSLVPTTIPTPQPTAMPYPIETPTEGTGPAGAVSFRLNKPVYEGDTQVSGTGTAGVPVILQDATFMGKNLAQAVIGESGTFVFQVPALEKNHRLGLALGNLDGTRWKPDDFVARAYQGDESMQEPWVGFYYDTVLVRAKP